jgi:hypothetical protein
MSEKSPLFVSAVELLAHATELYTQGNERKYKFVILHLANAIELILKDCLIDKGVSIYVPKRPLTIDIWDAFEKLEGVNITIPERPVIELLVDDRNTIQHRFGFPNADAVYFYLEQVVAFFKRFLNDQYGVNLADILKLYISQEDLEILGLIEKEEDKYAFLDKLFELSPESAIMQAYKLIENRFMQLMAPDPSFKGPFSAFWRMPDFPHLLDDLAIDKYISHNAVKQFQLLRDFRNRAAHAPVGDRALSVDWETALKAAKDLLPGLDKAVEEGYLSIRETRKRARSSETFGAESDSQTASSGEPS